MDYFININEYQERCYKITISHFKTKFSEIR